MSKKKKTNSIKTRNPFNLIQSITLQCKKDKNSFISIDGSEFTCSKKNRFEMKSFVVNKNFENINNEDLLKSFKRINKFAKMCKNPMEVISLVVDVYNRNRDDINIKVLTLPTHRDSIDPGYVYKSLIEGVDYDD